MDINKFHKASLSKEQLRDRLEKNSRGKIMTGIKVIDDVFGGIKKNDVVLLGARTGLGKSETISDIAMNASQQGKRVHIFSLESEDKEVEMRIAFKKIAQMTTKKIYYKKWYDNQYPELEDLYEKAVESINDTNINIYYRSNNFDIKEFTRNVMLVRDNSDLVIIDHIHYFDFEGKNENKELSDAIKQIRDIALLTSIPVILVAHLRKEFGGGKVQKIVPEIDDFHGSSDLTKVCTKAILLSSRATRSHSISRTFFYFPKFRQFGAARNYLFGCDYDLTKNMYSKDYSVYYFKKNDLDLLNNLEQVPSDELGWLG